MKLVHNERVKLLATGLNNIGIASIVSGIIAPASSFLYNGVTAEVQPGRLVALGAMWFAAGYIVMVLARHLLEGLQE